MEPLSPSIFQSPKARGNRCSKLLQVARTYRCTRRRCSLIAIRQQVQHLRPRLPKPPHLQPQRILPHIEPGYGANDVPFLRPQLQHAAAVLRRKRVARLPHVEEHAPIFQHRGAGMLRQKRLKLARECLGAQICNNGRHLSA